MRYLSLFFIITFMSTHAIAQLKYQGNPISPTCFAELLQQKNDKNASVDVRQCSDKTNQQKIKFDNGVYTTRDETQKKIQSFSDYTVIGQQEKRYLIDFGQWTGGSGYFTSIIWVARYDNILKLLAVYRSGDRCNGGTEKFGPWQYSVNLTSADLIEYAGDRTIKLVPYKDLDASASGCVAKVIYTYDPDKKASLFNHILIDQDMDVRDDWARRYRYQVCLNHQLRDLVEKGTFKMNMDDLQAFVSQFAQDCIKK